MRSFAPKKDESQQLIEFKAIQGVHTEAAGHSLERQDDQV
jgi:hypothetical protein